MHADRLRALIHRIEPPPGLAWAVAGIGEGDLWPDEAAAMQRALPRRRAEFAAGRAAARAAMAQLGLPAAPIPMGEDRAPVWPEGLIGSISHAEGLCLSVVARADSFDTLGVDLETDAPIDAELIAEICLPEELAGLPAGALGRRAKRLFSAKEAAYKAHYPRMRRIFGFHGVSVDLDAGLVRFTRHPDVAAFPPEFRADLPMRQVMGEGFVLSLCCVPARSPLR